MIGFVAVPGPDGRCQTERESGASPPGSVWRSSTPGTALGTLLRSPELPGDPLQEPGSDFRTAVQCAVWQNSRAETRDSTSTSEVLTYARRTKRIASAELWVSSPTNVSPVIHMLLSATGCFHFTHLSIRRLLQLQCRLSLSLRYTTTPTSGFSVYAR